MNEWLSSKDSCFDKSDKTHEVTMLASALNMMTELLTQLGQGNVVSTTPMNAEPTTQVSITNQRRDCAITLDALEGSG
ncbi:hypothetical protein AB6C91_20300 [Vibrio cyclitrophicus]